MNNLIYKLCLQSICIVSAILILTACQPERLKDPTPRSWSDADVDALIEWEHVKIRKDLPPELKAQAPEECNYISFLRFKPKDSPQDAAQADAVFLMIPGVLEGSTAFKHMARQMAYVAKTQHNKNFETWAYERRPNCMEDHSIMDDVEAAANATEAGRMTIDYYYGQKTVKGKTFDGIIKSADAPYLSEFGLTLSTEDLYTLMTTMMPNLSDRQQKLFLGGHSLGGLQTSIFMSWDFDGNPDTLDDAGYNNIAGAFAFDSILGDLEDITSQLTQVVPFGIGFLATSAAEGFSPFIYKGAVKALRENKLPRYVSVPNFFEPDVIAFPPLLAAIAQHNPKEENFITKEIEADLSPALNTMMDFFHPSIKGHSGAPRLTDFRYTNEALIGLFFDDDFSPLKFLGTSVGHLNGGELRTKPKAVKILAAIPLVGTAVSFALETATQYVAAQDNLKNDGPLYRWGNFDEVANSTDTTYTSGFGQVLTTASEEMADINDLVNSLYDRKTNLDLTEWYFSLRIMADISLAIPFRHAIKTGFPVYHRSSEARVPKIEFIGDKGLLVPGIELNIIPFTENVVMLEGQGHLDPLFEVVNAPERHTPVVVPSLIKFALDTQAALN